MHKVMGRGGDQAAAIPVDVRAATTSNPVRGRATHHPTASPLPTRTIRIAPSVHDEAKEARLYPARYAPRPAIVRCWYSQVLARK